MELGAYGSLRSQKQPKEILTECQQKNNARNRKNNTLRKAGEYLGCEVGTWDRKTATCSDKTCKKKRDFFFCSTP